MHWKRLGSRAIPGDVPARGAALAGERGVNCWTRPGALSSSRRTSSPHPLRMPRLRPAFGATFRPGCSTLPLADRVMPWTLRSSTRITSNRRARSVEAFSAQSLRRSASRASTGRWRPYAAPRRFEPRWPGRASAAAGAAAPLPPGQAGQGSISPVDKAALTATPRSIPTTSPVPGPGTGPGMTANATCQRPARSRVTR